MFEKRTLFTLCCGVLLVAAACNPARERDEEAAATGGVGTVGDTVYPPPPGQTGTPIAPSIGTPGTTPGAAAGDTLGTGQTTRP